MQRIPAPSQPPAPPTFDAFEVLGLVGTEDRRATAEQVCAADHACYDAPLRAPPAKIDKLCSAFPEGVRLCVGRRNGVWHPVGYTAWHPIAPQCLDDLASWPANVPVDRTGLEVAYLFNFSVVPALIGSEVARTLMRELDASVRGFPVLAADVVSAHGRRAAARWGMELRASHFRNGHPWELWVSPPSTRRP
jgi:hypothetical protein